MDELRELERKNDLMALVEAVREKVAEDRRVFTHPLIKRWCARRWRHFFLSEAVSDAKAIEFARQGKRDRRPYRQIIAERYLTGEDTSGWLDEQPDPQSTKISATTLLLCPGLLNGILPVRAFGNALPSFEKRFAMRVLRSDSHPLRGCDANTDDILAAFKEGKGFNASSEHIPANQARPPKDVFIIGYSKGAPDALTFLAKYPEQAKRVRCMFTWAGAIGGSTTADGVYAKIRNWENSSRVHALRLMLKGLVPGGWKTDTSSLRRLAEYDTIGAIRDLTTEVRDEFMDTHREKLDALNIPMFYLRGAANIKDVPLLQRRDFRALCKHDEKNDMQVTASRAELPLPMATDLGILNAHHWDLAYPAFVKRRRFNNMYHPFPKEAAVTAMALLAAELGLIE